MWSGCFLAACIFAAAVAVAVPHALAALAARDLLNRAAAHHRTRLFLQNVFVACAPRVFVFGFDEQPIVMALVARVIGPSVHAHKMPKPVQLLALEFEAQVNFGVSLVALDG